MKKFSILALTVCLTMSTTAISAQTSDSVIVRQLRDEGIKFSHDNSVVLLKSGQEKFDDLFKAVRPAKSSIHL